MPESETKHLPSFKSLDELVAFFDENDLGDYLDQMPEADFNVDIRQETLMLTLDPDLANKLRNIARERHTTTPALIKNWLRDKLQENS